MASLISTVRQALGVAALGSLVATSAAIAPAQAAGGGEIHRNHWSFSGMFGGFNQAQLQRGFQVYRDVCANCHGLSRIAFRNLVQPGGPAFPEDGVRSLAQTYKITDGPNDQGKMFQRPGRLSDTIPPPYQNEQEARSIQNGAYPPDLSLMARARNVEYAGSLWYHPLSMLKDIVTGYQEGGADYIYALLTGYHEKAPAYRRDAGGKLVPIDDKDVRDEKAVVRCVAVEKGVGGKPDTCTPMADLMHYNTAFPGHQIAMAQPLSDGLVKYTDGTAGTVSNYAADVAAFLSWTADPSLEARKRLGWQVMLYLLITAVLLYLGKRALWRDVH